MLCLNIAFVTHDLRQSTLPKSCELASQQNEPDSSITDDPANHIDCCAPDL